MTPAAAAEVALPWLDGTMVLPGIGVVTCALMLLSGWYDENRHRRLSVARRGRCAHRRATTTDVDGGGS